MESSFREKKQWLIIIAMLVVYGFYFSRVLPPSGPEITIEQASLFIGLLVPLVGIFIIGAVLMAISGKAETVQEDERDRLIALKSMRNAHYLLASGAVISVSSALFTEGNFWFAHLMLATLVLAQVFESASCLFYYRRGF
jgi:hypothetical protein